MTNTIHTIGVCGAGGTMGAGIAIVAARAGFRTISFDVLIGNLPNAVTESLLMLMPRLSFRTAILAVGESADLDKLSDAFSWFEVTRITGDDFLPPQPSVSRIVRVVPGCG